MKAAESTVSGACADGYFEADWAQPRPSRRACAAAAEQRRLSREFRRARALAQASPRPERRVRMQAGDGGMARVFSGMKFSLNALSADLVLNERIAEKILAATGFLERETVPSI